MDYEVAWSPENVSSTVTVLITSPQILITAIIHGKRLLEAVSARFDTPDR